MSSKETAGTQLASSIKMESPLVAVTAEMAAWQEGKNKFFSMVELPFLELLNVKGEPQDSKFGETVEKVVGIKIPLVPNTVHSQGEDRAVYWLAPDEWLVRSTASQSVKEALTQALADQFSLVCDVSSGNTTLILKGEKAAAILAKGCPLDLHPRVFPQGSCAQSHFFKTGLLIRRIGSEAFEVVVRRSFADYFVRMLHDAAQEFA